jgi:hypothetical protein
MRGSRQYGVNKLQIIETGERIMTHIGHHHHHHHCGPRPMNAAALAKGFVLQLTASIMGHYMNALGAGPFAFAQMPRAFDVRCGHFPGGCFPKPRCPGPIICPEPKAQWTAKMDSANTAKIDLGDGNKLEIDERSSQITIINEKTGERTRIWGDPHVEIDGKQAYDFWGTTTFTLENGTKITINTEQWGGNPNAYVASQVVITKGDNAIIVDGVSQNQIGDLSVTMSQNGQAIDDATRDGFTLHENASGSGWRTELGNIATQNDLNATAKGREYGPGSDTPSLGEIGNFLGDFLLLGLFATFLGAAFGGGAPTRPAVREAEPEPRTPETRPVANPRFDPVFVDAPLDRVPAGGGGGRWNDMRTALV